jgi:hypothetical protein
MKRMIQMLVCFVLATVLVMGSMANAMAQSLGGATFFISPRQLQELQINQPGQPFMVRYNSPAPTKVLLFGGSCKQEISVPPGGIAQLYDCGFTTSVSFLNTGGSPVVVSAK